MMFGPNVKVLGLAPCRPGCAAHERVQREPPAPHPGVLRHALAASTRATRSAAEGVARPCGLRA